MKEKIDRINSHLEEYKKALPESYSDKVYDAVTIDEGIEEVSRCGFRRGLEYCIELIKKELIEYEKTM